MKQSLIVELLIHKKKVLSDSSESKKISKERIMNFFVSANLDLAFNCYSISALAGLKKGDRLACEQPVLNINSEQTEIRKKMSLIEYTTSGELQAEVVQ